MGSWEEKEDGGRERKPPLSLWPWQDGGRGASSGRHRTARASCRSGEVGTGRGVSAPKALRAQPLTEAAFLEAALPGRAA